MSRLPPVSNPPTKKAGRRRLPSLQPPHPCLLLAEGRAFSEYALYVATSPLQLSWPRGDGHPVMTLPGMGADDTSMRPMRRLLRSLGYFTHRWRQGINRARPETERALVARLRALYRRHGQPLSLIGWSMGGIYAREIAKQVPEAVRQVITLASPFTGHPLASNALGLYWWLSRREPQVEERWFTFRTPPPVPTTSVYSRSDGIVNWRCTLNTPGRLTENIRVNASHCGIGHHPAALYAIADRLAQARDGWRPFRPRGLARWLFPQPDDGSD